MSKRLSKDDKLVMMKNMYKSFSKEQVKHLEHTEDVDVRYKCARRYLRELNEGKKGERVKAMEYYKKASDMGDAWSAVQLGMMYSLGQGTETDYEKGFEYYKLGYERGDVLACANLGWCFETGQGTEKDLDKALRYYWEGASRGEEHCVEAVKRLSDPAFRAYLCLVVFSGNRGRLIIDFSAYRASCNHHLSPFPAACSKRPPHVCHQ